MKIIRPCIVCAIMAVLLLLNAAEAFGQRSISAKNTLRDNDLINASDISKLSKLPEGFDAAADSYEFVGDNLVVRGNAVIRAV